jgi:hypothetical protein
MAALFVCTRHIPLYTTLYRHMTVYDGICRDIRSAGFQMKAAGGLFELEAQIVVVN